MNNKPRDEIAEDMYEEQEEDIHIRLHIPKEIYKKISDYIYKGIVHKGRRMSINDMIVNTLANSLDALHNSRYVQLDDATFQKLQREADELNKGEGLNYSTRKIIIEVVKVYLSLPPEARKQWLDNRFYSDERLNNTSSDIQAEYKELVKMSNSMGLIEYFKSFGANYSTQDLEAVLTELIDDKLNERERLVINMRYGLGDCEPHTLDQVGDILGVTRERARQIEEKALDKFKKHIRKEIKG